MNTLPLQNVRVLDLTRLLPGGICTLMLVDEGAEVIKIEQPDVGDYARWYVPRVGDYAAFFHAINRNKRSIGLDLKQPEGLDIFKRLVLSADILIDSFRPEVMTRLGITFDDLKTVNPRLIVCSLSGLGQQGAMANLAVHDLNLAGMTGILAAGNEQVLPIQAIDFGGAYLAAFAITTALFQRERTGEGTFIDVSLLDAGLSLMTMARAESFARHMNPVPGGELLSGGYACYRVYRTTDDKPITLAALEPKFWQQFCILAGRDDLAQRDHLMLEDQSDLTAEITALFASKTYAEWMVILDGSETCATPLLDVMQSETDAQIQSRGALFHADGVAHTFTPFRMGERIAYRPAPALGADTDQILQEAGYGIEELASLRERHIIR